MYDYLIVGAGLFGSIFAHEATKRGFKCLVIDKRSHLGGNCYTENVSGINVHKYGAHIFRTSDRSIWNYLAQFAEFNNFINSPLAYYKGRLFNLPFNMNTFYQMWGVVRPEEAEKILKTQRMEIKGKITNLEQKAISLIGRDLYEILVKGYTEKQWGKPCQDLPESIIRRIPFRLRFDNNYFNDKYQGIPEGGYTQIFEKMLSNCEVKVNVSFSQIKSVEKNIARKIVYTGPIDEYYDYKYGPLEYRSLEFREKRLDVSNFQGVAVMNFTDKEIPYTRIIEHKHFEFGNQDFTIITEEYPRMWNVGDEPYYPINDTKNQNLYNKYRQEAEGDKRLIFGGRLGEYQYYDMQDTIKQALATVANEFGS